MRRYDDPVEVRQDATPEGAPAQFLWRDRLWQVRDVQARWVETGAWWRSAAARSALGMDEPGTDEPGATLVEAPPGLLDEREVWRVAAGRGQLRALGVFDLARDAATGRWRLVGCLD